MRASRLLKTLSIQAAIILVTIAAVDAAIFFSLPDQIATQFPGYREGFYAVEIMGRGYPKDYFEANAERGFDIKPTDVPRTDQIHHMDEYSYHVWSNSIGCFDKPLNTATASLLVHGRRQHRLGSCQVRGSDGHDPRAEGRHRYSAMRRHPFGTAAPVLQVPGDQQEARPLAGAGPGLLFADRHRQRLSVSAYDRSRRQSSPISGCSDRNNNIVDLDEGWFKQVKAQRERDKPGARRPADQLFPIARADDNIR